MISIVYIGNFSRLIRTTFGDTIQGEFITENLPLIVDDYDEMKRHCSDVCARVNYEYVDEHLYLSFVKKWQKRLRQYNQRHYVQRAIRNGYNSEKYS